MISITVCDRVAPATHTRSRSGRISPRHPAGANEHVSGQYGRASSPLHVSRPGPTVFAPVTLAWSAWSEPPRVRRSCTSHRYGLEPERVAAVVADRAHRGEYRNRSQAVAFIAHGTPVTRLASIGRGLTRQLPGPVRRNSHPRDRPVTPRRGRGGDQLVGSAAPKGDRCFGRRGIASRQHAPVCVPVCPAGGYTPVTAVVRAPGTVLPRRAAGG